MIQIYCISIIEAQYIIPYGVFAIYSLCAVDEFENF